MPFAPMQGCPKCQALAQGIPMVTGAVKYTCPQCTHTWVVDVALK